jgi:hypothetical protein
VEEVYWIGRGKGKKECILDKCMNRLQCPIVYWDVLRHKLDSSFELLETPIPGSISLFTNPHLIFFDEDEKNNPNPVNLINKP